MLKLLLSSAAIGASLGCSSLDGEPIIERKLQDSVGWRFSSTDWSSRSGARTAQHLDAEGNREHEFTFRNGCNVVIIVDAKTDLILSWRYGANPEACRSIRAYRFGT